MRDGCGFWPAIAARTRPVAKQAQVWVKAAFAGPGQTSGDWCDSRGNLAARRAAHAAQLKEVR
jgi:hypothetical protein